MANQAAPSHGAMPAGLSLDHKLIIPSARVKTPTGRTARSCGDNNAFMRLFGSTPSPVSPSLFRRPHQATRTRSLYTSDRKRVRFRFCYGPLRGPLRVGENGHKSSIQAWTSVQPKWLALDTLWHARTKYRKPQADANFPKTCRQHDKTRYGVAGEKYPSEEIYQVAETTQHQQHAKDSW